MDEERGGREGVEQAERAKSGRDKVPTNHPPDADGGCVPRSTVSRPEVSSMLPKCADHDNQEFGDDKIQHYRVESGHNDGRAAYCTECNTSY